ncbi:MAG: NAD(P)-dependent oxidoreductase [Patescibacteria group bacterium]
MSKSYFIVGGNGQLGKALTQHYPLATVVGRAEFDVTNPNSYELIDWSQYDTIINAAGMTDVDGAETSKGRELAWSVNASAAALMAATATKHSLTLMHISSDYVFDGTKAEHSEDEPFTPLSTYGQSKTAGDIAASVVKKHYILRTSWVIGDGTNFISVMRSLARKGVSPKVVNDQIGRLTFTSTLTNAIDHLLSTTPVYGTYNCTNGGDSVSWADIAKLVFEKAGRNTTDVTNVTTQEYYASKDNFAARPLQSTLSLKKIENTGFIASDWRDELNVYWDRMEEL